MSLKEHTVKGVVWSGLDTFGQYIIQFIVTIILARILSPADFGLIEMLIIFSSISNVMLDSGFGQALIRKKDATEVDYSSVFFFNIFCAFILYLILFFSAPYISDFYSTPQLTLVSRVFFIVIIFNSFVLIQNTILSKYLKFKTLAKASLISSLVSGAIGIFLAYKGYGVWALVFQGLSQTLIKVIMLWLLNSWRPIIRFEFQSIKQLWSFSSKLMFNGLLDVIFTNLQALVIGKFYTKTDLGFYSQAKKFQSLPSQTLTQIVQKVTYPILSKIQDDNLKLKEGYKKIIQITTFVVFTIMLYLIAVADNLFYVVLSEKWLPAVAYFRPLCIIGILYPLQSINNNIFLVKGQSALLLKLALIRRVLVILSLFIAVKLGILALVWSLVFTYVVTGMIFIFYAGNLIQYGLMSQLKDVFPTFILAFILASLTYFLTNLINTESQFLILIFQSLFYFILFCVFIHVFKIQPYIDIKKILLNFRKKKTM